MQLQKQLIEELNTNRLQLSTVENSRVWFAKEIQTILGGSSGIWRDPKLAKIKPGEAKRCGDGNDLSLLKEGESRGLKLLPTHCKIWLFHPFVISSILKTECYLFILVKIIMQKLKKK